MTATREKKLAEAYRSTFIGSPTKAETDMVLADLATFTGFFTALGPEASGDALRYVEGRRSVFAHIQVYLKMTGANLDELHRAALVEASSSKG